MYDPAQTTSRITRLRRTFCCLCVLVSLACPPRLAADTRQVLSSLVGRDDTVLIGSDRGDIVFDKHGDKKLVPASVLKVFTSLVALKHLGPDYRFPTEFYLDEEGNLKIKGYGDPLLTSETLGTIAQTLSTKITGFKDLVLDDSYFHIPAEIPGTSGTYNPFDAPNGALCVNFNTVAFRRSGGRYVSGEDQTPLLPFVYPRIKESALPSGRIVLSHDNHEITKYAGHLFNYFFQLHGLKTRGGLSRGPVISGSDRVIFLHHSPFTLREVVTKLLNYSNNFMANQLLIATGATVYGPPGTLEKGVRAALLYAAQSLNLRSMSLEEGSGLSRGNRVSARMMLRVLNEFEEYHQLMRQEHGEFYKTGSLRDVKSRAGYLETEKGKLYRFVVLINTPGKSTGAVMKQIRRFVDALGR